MHSMYRMSFHIGGCGSPSQVIAWITTAIALIPATEAAVVWM